jgi:integrase
MAFALATTTRKLNMAVINLTPGFLATKLVCPAGKKKVEYCDSTVRGLVLEVRSASGSVPTWFWRYKDQAGKTRLHHLGSLTNVQLDEARKQVQLLKAQHALGQHVQANAPTSAEGMTLATFWTQHYAPYARDHKRSYPRDEQLYRLRIAPRFGPLPLRSIKRVDVEAFHRAIHAEGLSKASANHHLQLMRRLMHVAVSHEVVDRNPLKGVRLFALENQVTTFLGDGEVDRLVAVLRTDCVNPDVCRIAEFLLSTGCRLREALDARWQEIDLEHAFWRIPASRSKGRRFDAKPLNDSARQVLEGLDSREKSEFVFPSPATGKPYTTITRAWYRLRRLAGLPDSTRIHDLRHAFASRLVSRGRSLFEVQQLLGHADPRTSMRYAHLSMKAKQEAAQAASLSLA